IWRFKQRKPRSLCARRPENESAGHQRMQTKTLPESQNHGDWRESKSRRPFFRSLLDPEATAEEGGPWPGPRCGMTYKFVAPNNPKPPSRNFDEIFVEI